jgi:PAS domain S-box-containing protein
VADGDGELEVIPGLTVRGVLDALPRAVVVTDPAGRIVLWNRPAERLYGWSEAEVVGSSVLDVLAPPNEREENQERLAARASGTTFAGDRTVVSRSGDLLRVLVSTRPVVGASGEVVGIVGAAEDVSGLRVVEQQARDLTDHLRLAVEASGLGTWRWTIATEAVMLDERFETLLGLSPGGFDGTFEMFELAMAQLLIGRPCDGRYRKNRSVMRTTRVGRLALGQFSRRPRGRC